jgi:hypothetical protein
VTQKNNRPFIIRIPPNVCDKGTLLAQLAEAGRFPDYFGHNWDALAECLCDLSWLPEGPVCIEHEGLPLADDPESLSVYNGILSEAVAATADSPRPLSSDIDEWTRPDSSHEGAKKS